MDGPPIVDMRSALRHTAGKAIERRHIDDKRHVVRKQCKERIVGQARVDNTAHACR